MKISTWLACAFLFIVSLSTLPGESFARKASARFKFLVTPAMFYTVAFGTNFKLNCTTNDGSATTDLYHTISVGSNIWKLLSPRPGKIVKSGPVYTVLDFGISDAGQYQCRATNALGAGIRWSDQLSIVFANPSLTPPLNIDPEHAVVLTTGQSYNITCSSISLTTLQWFKKFPDGTQTAVPSSQTYSETDSDLYTLKLVLMFKNAQKDDTGTYVCKMTYQGKTNYKYSSLSVYASARFKFLVTPAMFYTVAFGTNFKLNCTTNDGSATTDLYHTISVGSNIWKLLSPRPGKIVKSGPVYTVLDFGISDAGQYQCRATNALGAGIRWSDQLSIVFANPSLTPPLNIDPEHAVVLTTGQSYNITCSSISLTTLQWFKKFPDGTQTAVPSSQTYSETDSDLYTLKLVLMFKNAQKDDTGTYVCKMTYQGKTNYKYSSLSVYASARFKFLVTPAMFYTVAFGTNFKLNCTTNDGSATTDLYHTISVGSNIWKLLSPRPGKIVKSGPVYTVLDFGISDAGQYQCRATNALGAGIRWSDQLSIVFANPNLTPPLNIDPEHAVVLTTGQSYNITCSSISLTTLQWFKKFPDGTQTAVPSSQTDSETDSDLNTLKLVLMFKNAQKEDTGTYVCKMTYQGKTNYKYSSLSVYASARFKFLVTPAMFYTVAFGTNFKLNCTTNDGSATTELYHTNSVGSNIWKLLSPRPGKIVKSGPVYTVLDFGISDAGQYQCRATNALGAGIRWSDKLSIVFANPNLTPPLNIDPEHAVVLTTGQSYNITCSSISLTTLQWFKKFPDGTQTAVPSSQTYSETDSDLYTLKLVLMFKNAHKDDTGTYVCKMTYQGKTNYKYSSLSVYDKGSSPHLKSRTKHLSVNETSRVVMSCTAIGDPLPNITWYKGSNLIGCLNDGQLCGPLLQYTLKRKTKTKNNTKLVRSWLRISRISRVRDQGTYTCVASNKHGVAKRSYQLRVLD